jgi:RHH-type proline utilization regulon transcriptional repressor/proline dehydrogenase/delta 1-pyrroline-5-carboxylate dehydrogenase
LRVLFIQEDVADGMIKMIAGAMEALNVGNPSDLATDVGPVIDEAAKNVLDEHLEWLDKNAKLICQLKAPKEAANGCFVLREMIDAISDLNARIGPDFARHPICRDRLGRSSIYQRHRLWPDAGPRAASTPSTGQEHARVGNFTSTKLVKRGSQSQPRAKPRHYPAGGRIMSRRDRSGAHRHHRCRGNASLMATLEG